MKTKELEIALTTYRVAYKKGYTQCQEDMTDKKYTEEDIRNAFFSGGVMKDVNEFNHFINSLNKQE